MERAEWLSEGVEKLAFELLEREAGDDPHCDVVVVGSGYGGAVAAARLAGATQTVEGKTKQLELWLLERGREFVPGAFPERFGELFGHVRVDAEDARETWGLGEGLFDLRLGKHVSTLLGNGLGGGSLINAGVLAQPEADVFRRGSWSGLVDYGALKECFKDVEEMLGATTLPGIAPPKLAALEALAGRIDGAASRRAQIAVTFKKGESFTQVAQEACLQCADCMTGCNHQAKNTLAMNYLPLAKRRDARLFTGVTVDTITGEDGAWTLALEFTDSQLRTRFGRKLPPLRARRVVLAAGTYGSTAILMRSGKAGLTLSPKLGAGFSTNGDMIATATGMPARVNASAKESELPGARHVGPTITGIIDAKRDGLHVTIEELAIPAALRRLFEEVVTTFGALHDLGRIDRSTHYRGPGRDPAAIDPDAIERTAVYATFGDDGAQGKLVLRPRLDDSQIDSGLCVDWKHVADAPIFGAAMALLAQAHGDDAIVIPNPMWTLLPSNIGEALEGGEIGGAVFTVHPLGGCAMASRAEHGVVNAHGQLFKAKSGSDVYRTLVVLDGSIVPVALGTNPCLTIAALAEHAVRQLAPQEGWSLNLADRRKAAIDALKSLDPPPSRQIERPAPAPTAIRFAERLKGALTLGDRAYDAALEIEYAPLPDLEAFLRRPKRVLSIPKARLRLVTPAGSDAQLVQQDLLFSLAGELTLLEREATTFWRRLWTALRAWWTNRGKRDILAWLRRKWRRLAGIGSDRAAAQSRPSAASQPPQRGPIEWLKGGLDMLRSVIGVLRGWIAVASHAGERRLMRYHLSVIDAPAPHDPTSSEAPPLARGDCLHGTKVIAYVAQGSAGCRWPSPWDQLTKLPLLLNSDQSDASREIGVLDVDLPYWVQQHAAQLQIAGQEDQPRALADLFSLLAYVARVVGKIHIWSFRAPDYPYPYPIYEFAASEVDKAQEAAAEQSIGTVSRLEYRRPARAMARFNDRARASEPAHRSDGGIEGKVVTLDPADNADDPKAAFLTHYVRKGRRPEAPLRPAPVLLIHGLGAGGNTFTVPTIPCNLVQHLIAADYDPWVLDLRTSIGVPSSKREWGFDEVARGDIPRAIEIIRDQTQRPQVDVVAHCIGAAMFCMAALEGSLPERSVRAAVLSQVGPLLELPPTNRFRGYAASHLKHYLDIDELDTASTLTGRNRFVDRLLATLPYPEEEWALHKHGWRPVTHEAYCLRAYGIYGRLFEHANMNAETLAVLGDLLGHLKYKTYQQTIFYATMRRLTGADGENRYVTYDNIRCNLAFPLLFLHGAKNEVFDKQSSRRSFDLLASIFWSDDLKKLWAKHPARRYDYGLYAQGRHLRIVEIDGFGHQDCMIGANAYRKVYPEITRFLQECAASKDSSPSLRVVRPPRMGPILGWVRPNSKGRGFLARVLFAPNTSRSTPQWAIAIVLKAGAVKSARFHRLRAGAVGAPPTEALDVALPATVADYRIVVLTLHEEQFEPEPARDSGEPRGDDPFGEDLDRFPSGLTKMPSKDGQSAMRYAEDVLRTCKDLGLRREPLATGRHVSHRRYATPVSTALVSRGVLAAARRKQPASATLRFALASCRYAAMLADREAADAAFGRLSARLQASPGDAPQLLFLAGDNIYADATYGLFDPAAPKDRFDQRYLEAWTAPNAREVLRRLPVYPMLDDHEVEENFGGAVSSPEQRKGLEAFEAFQLRLTPAFETAGQDRPNLSSGMPPGFYPYTLMAGACAFFVADSRAQREPQQGRDSVKASIMRPEQMRALQQWLVERQKEEPGAPKFVVSPSVVAPWSCETAGDRSYALRADAWDGYPESLQELLGFIAGEPIQNVVFLSGDYHCSLFCRMRLSREGEKGVDAYSIVSSGLYAPFPFANTRFDALRLNFKGPYRWHMGERGAVQPGELVIRYKATPIDCGDGFAVVRTERRKGAWRMSVEFDGRRGTHVEALQLAP